MFFYPLYWRNSTILIVASLPKIIRHRVIFFKVYNFSPIYFFFLDFYFSYPSSSPFPQLLSLKVKLIFHDRDRLFCDLLFVLGGKILHVFPRLFFSLCSCHCHSTFSSAFFSLQTFVLLLKFTLSSFKMARYSSFTSFFPLQSLDSQPF